MLKVKSLKRTKSITTTKHSLEQHKALVAQVGQSYGPFIKGLHLIANNIARIIVVDLDQLIKDNKHLVCRDDDTLVVETLDKQLTAALHTLESYLTSKIN